MMFFKSKARHEEIVSLLTEIRDELKEGRVNAILAGVMASADNNSVVRAAGPLYEVAIQAESETRKVK